jgi:ubiquinol-cytochrome c reductase iron-sulfur subunit
MAESTGLSRRHFLVVATAVTGIGGLAAAAVPFVASFRPSARAQALGGPVEVDISKVEPGQLMTVEWRGRPIWVLHRTSAMLEALERPFGRLADPESQSSVQPEYAQNAHRSVRPAFLVVEGLCTHLGCVPLARFTPGAPELGANWPGGFYCPCHGSTFDLAGRVYSGVPADANLPVPPHRYITESLLLIGSDIGTA